VPRQSLAEILSIKARRPEVAGQSVSEILAIPDHPKLRTGREVLAARLGLQVTADVRQQRNAIQFEEEIPENPWVAKEETGLSSGKVRQYTRTAYQETAPSNLEQAGFLGSRERVFAILSPVARGVAMQEAAKKRASLATSSPPLVAPTLPPATVEQLEAWKRLQEEERRVQEEERRVQEEELMMREQELQEQHLLWQQQRMQELQDSWKEPTTKAEALKETTMDTTKVEELLISEQTSGQEGDEDALQREEEEEEVERLQSELHAQLLAQLPPRALASLAPQLDGLRGEIEQAQMYTKARLAREEAQEQMSSLPTTPTENIWSFKFSY